MKLAARVTLAMMLVTCPPRKGRQCHHVYKYLFLLRKDTISFLPFLYVDFFSSTVSKLYWQNIIVMKKTLLITTVLLSAMSLKSQNNVTVTFTCRTTDSIYVPSDHVVVENLDREWTETIHFPDTVYQLMVGTGVSDNPGSLGLVVSPNPFDGTTRATYDLVLPGEATVELTDLAGRILAARLIEVQHPGRCYLRISISHPGIYLLHFRQSGKSVSAKIVNSGCGNGNAVELDGIAEEGLWSDKRGTSLKAISSHPFQIGDRMRYVAYASGHASDEVIQQQNESDTLTLLFNHFIELGDSLPCPGTPTLTDYDGNVYNTVKIGNQCWMRENLRTTHYADGTEIPLGGEVASFTDPLYFNHPVGSLTLAERGYLYNWPALMNGDSSSYGIPSGVQGVCPDGWHVPSRPEWAILIDYLGNHNEYTCNNIALYIGKAVAVKTNWPESPYTCCVGHYPHSNNATGFSALSAGYCIGSSYDNAGAFFSTCTYTAKGRAVYTLSYNSVTLNSTTMGKQIGLSVRCLRD